MNQSNSETTLVQISENSYLNPFLSTAGDHQVVPVEGACAPTVERQAEKKIRTSSYLIYVDLPDDADSMLLVHGYTGAYDIVSREVAAFLRSLEPRRAPKPLYGVWTDEPISPSDIYEPSDTTLGLLRRRGYLTSLTLEEEERFLEKFAAALHVRHSKTPSYIFMPTYDCNLRCSYCFQNHMRTDSGYKHLLRTMSCQTVDRIFKGIAEIETQHGIFGDEGTRSFGFFGGEPLLASSRGIIEYIMQKARSTGAARFWAVTNGTELAAYADLLGQDGIAMVQITLDGPEREHDIRRIRVDGSGTFEAIAKNIDLALQCNVSVSVRLNLDRNNIGMVPELLESIHSHGWDSHELFSVYAAPIHAANDNVEKSATFDSWELNQSLSRLAASFPRVSMVATSDDKLKSQARRIFSLNNTDFSFLQESFCGAHTGMYIFDAFADIYACWERTGDSSIRIGRIADDGSLDMNAALLNMWRSRTVASNPVCRRCRYALHCGGGCAVLAHGRTGNYHTNFCDGFASRFRNAVAQAYKDHISGVLASPKAERICDL